MKGNLLVVILAVLVIVGCNGMRSSTETSKELTEEMVSRVIVKNITVQERVSGIQGGRNSIEFKLNIETGKKYIVPDSLFYKQYKCKLNLVDSVNALYKAVSRKEKNISNAAARNDLSISFKGSNLKRVVSNENVSILAPLYMP